MYGAVTIGTGPVSVWRAFSIRLRRGLAARSAAGQSVGVRAGIGIGFGSVIAARGRVSVFLSECGAGRDERREFRSHPAGPRCGGKTVAGYVCERLGPSDAGGGAGTGANRSWDRDRKKARSGGSGAAGDRLRHCGCGQPNARPSGGGSGAWSVGMMVVIWPSWSVL